MLILDPNIRYFFKCKQCSEIFDEFNLYSKHVLDQKHIGVILIVVDVNTGSEFV